LVGTVGAPPSNGPVDPACAALQAQTAAMMRGSGFKIGSCRREEAEGADSTSVSASSRRRLRAESNLVTASREQTATKPVKIQKKRNAFCHDEEQFRLSRITSGRAL
jgi:hypothetical protein